jgi:Kae1-associated kinase Bud32
MECEIVMEYIDSPRVKDIFNSMGSETRKSLCYQIGRNIGIMHSHNIIHGDLTTSNMLLSHEKLYFIDFSLGEKTSSIEAKGVDLHVLMEAFESTHSEIRDAFQLVFDAYQEEFGKADEVERKIQYIIKRGRYA